MSDLINSNSEKYIPVQLRHELVGRLRNISKLKHWQMAVAEAVKNAMDAIEVRVALEKSPSQSNESQIWLQVGMVGSL